ncbi:phenylalanine 4-monooxygenase [Candidatus Nomurabacteria bacterium]|nr:phenylalanine 4-monooxygenase [Candidatus Nomurabacteria bacterium]
MNQSIPDPKEILAILDLDHPGAHDKAYRKRREMIAGLAKEFRGNIDTIPKLVYLDQEHTVWYRVNAELESLHHTLACQEYLDMREKIHLPLDHIPQMQDLSKRIFEITQFSLMPIEGLVDSRSFLGHLADGKMFCTQYIRHPSKPEFTPEPDVIHEFVGHVPMFASDIIVEITKLIGKKSLSATDRQLQMLERIYWFTLEYGVIEENGKHKAYGAGFLGGIEEISKLQTGKALVEPFDIKKIVETDFNYSFLQPRYFSIQSFRELYQELERFFVSDTYQLA